MRLYHITNRIGAPLIIGILFVAMPVVTAGQSAGDSAIISQTVSTFDSSAPTVPTGLSATAVSTSEINLAWDASSDNVGVTGYQVFRDAVQIATTSSTSYSDTGLTEGTAYTYTVTAFDAADNISSQSSPASATTQTTEAAPTVQGGGGPPDNILQLKLTDVRVSPEIDSAVIQWETNKQVTAILSWGLTQDYELGSLSPTELHEEYKTFLENLAPDTIFYFKIEVKDNIGNKAGVIGTFTTRDIYGGEKRVSNVSDFQAEFVDDGIDLSWKNPIEKSFRGVRLVRNDKFFPTDQNDGLVIHEGTKEFARDDDVVAGKTYYYGIFTKDDKDRYSSGAVLSVYIPEEGEVVVDRYPFEDFPEAPEIPQEFEGLELEGFQFIQDGNIILPIEGLIHTDGTKNLTLRLPYEAVPEVLKTIAVTLEDPENSAKTFTFLLRINEDKTYYEATTAPLGKSGTYPLAITMLDYKNQRLTHVSGNLVASVHEFTVPSSMSLEEKIGTLLGILIILAFLFLLILIARRFKKREFRISN